jgi:hypothetical protein
LSQCIRPLLKAAFAAVVFFDALPLDEILARVTIPVYPDMGQIGYFRTDRN